MPFLQLTIDLFFPFIWIIIFISSLTRNCFSIIGHLSSESSPLGLSIYCGITLVKILRKLGYEDVSLKWPNDLITEDGRKLGGILAELSAEAEQVRFVVMSDRDQALYTWYSDEVPAVQAFLERHFEVGPEFIGVDDRGLIDDEQLYRYRKIQKKANLARH